MDLTLLQNSPRGHHGQERRYSWLASLTELIDSGLDGSEAVGRAPEIDVKLETDWLAVMGKGRAEAGEMIVIANPDEHTNACVHAQPHTNGNAASAISLQWRFDHRPR